MTASAILWFRRDLRLADNAALGAALASGKRIIPLYIWAPEEDAPWSPGAASRWWLQHALQELRHSLLRLGSQLVLRQGAAAPVLVEVAKRCGAAAVYCGRGSEPLAQARDAVVRRELQREGIALLEYPGALLSCPARLLNTQGAPYRIFTPFYTALSNSLVSELETAPDTPQTPEAVQSRWLPSGDQIAMPAAELERCGSLHLDDLRLCADAEQIGELNTTWTPGEAGAHALLHRLTTEIARHYDHTRDRLDLDGTSRLSPHLHFGELSPGQVWRALQQQLRLTVEPSAAGAIQSYLRQIIWREFAHYILHFFPHTAEEPLRKEFHDFPWLEDSAALNAWQSGATGYPIVDAAMHQLAQTGWMHNRARMVTASFLTKHLLQPWQAGARWFWEALVDADLANNSFGWQWSAGSGADAAPYFRIFNPVLQGAKYDPQGVYVKCYLPQLAGLPLAYMHQPWAAPASVLAAAGVRLGQNYPRPCIEHQAARRRALAAHASLKRVVP